MKTPPPNADRPPASRPTAGRRRPPLGRRRPLLTLACAWCAAAAAAVGQVAPGVPAGSEPVAPAAEVDAAGGDLDVTAPAVRAPRAKKKAIAEGAWYLFFVTAGALIALLGVAWGFGYYKRQFLSDDGPLSGELFDARAQAEIERHRREVQAEREAEREAEAAGDARAAGGAGAETPGTDDKSDDGTLHHSIQGRRSEPAAGPAETDTAADLAARTAPAFPTSDDDRGE